MTSESTGLYPIVLRLCDRRVLVVGGGKVGARKAAGLVEAGAHVVVVSPRFAPAFARLVDTATLTLIERRYTAEDLAGMALVVAATDDSKVNAQIRDDARRAGVLVSVVDNPRASDFVVPAVVRRGDLLVAISTGGRSPGLAGQLRRELDLLVPEDWEVLVRLLGVARARVQTAVENPARSSGIDEAAHHGRYSVDAPERWRPSRRGSGRRAHCEVGTEQPNDARTASTRR